MPRLELFIFGHERVIADFEMLIVGLLKLGKELKLIDYQMIRQTDVDPLLEKSQKRRTEITDELLAKLKILGENGISIDEIAVRLKIHPATAKRHLTTLGLYHPKPPISEEDISEFVRLYTIENWSARRIGLDKGFSTTTITTHLIKAGVLQSRRMAQNATTRWLA